MRTSPLSAFSARDLAALLDEEAVHWQSELLWDYSEVSAAVRAGLERGSLLGRAAVDEGEPVAYCYFIQESGRAVVGSLYAAAAQRGRGREEALLGAVLEDALADSENRRVECQTLFSTSRAADGGFARAGFRSLPRHYLMRELKDPIPEPRHAFELRSVRKDDLPRVADLVYKSHRGSLDAALNLTYGTAAHCRSFVDTLALRAGCGSFDSEASLLAEGRGGPIGVLLASRLSGRAGHICQVSVSPEAQGNGLGTALVVAALRAFRRQGHASASLSVTVGNEPAYRLYERLGFRLRKAFGAHAWVRPPATIELPA
jgi:ribosomal protein S18 acetylase RimI-like enzyme